MTGATGASGLPEVGAVPVVRELSAYRADDKRPVLAAPWVLSVNANPSAESHLTPGGELTNDALLDQVPAAPLRRSSCPACGATIGTIRSLGSRGEPLDAPPHDEAGQLLEVIEGDDPLLDAQLLAQSSPPPIAALSGSDDWDYAAQTEPDPKHPRAVALGPAARRARWRSGAARARGAPARGALHGLLRRRAAARPARGHRPAPGSSPELDLTPSTASCGAPAATRSGLRSARRLERAWPGYSPRPRAVIQFVPGDPLFADLAGPEHRSTTQALPESHTDAIRADAFLPGGPLERFEVLATSAFCAPDVVAASPRDGVFPNPGGAGLCDTVPEAFRSRDPAWPILGMQFHVEQKDFSVPGPGDPPSPSPTPACSSRRRTSRWSTPT